MRRSSILALFLLFPLLGGGAGALPAQTRGAETRDSRLVTVVLVRHAEKMDDSRDPILSEAGKARSAELARLLGEAGITHVWSTDYQRTRLTAQPLAERLGLTVMSYDPSRLEEFAGRLRATPGRHLVVGHSNTTGEMVRALGGDPGKAIQDIEYDRLYLVFLGADPPVTALLRFGSAGQ